MVCPGAHAKLFIIASIQTRAQRRTKELQSAGQAVTYTNVLADMRARDTRDAERLSAPMVAAEDALTLDTSDLSADEVFAKAIAYIDSRLYPA